MAGASSQEIRAGSAYVELSAKDGPLRSRLDAAASYIKSFGASVASVGKQIQGLGKSILAPFKEYLSEFRETAGMFRVMAMQTGDTVEDLSRLSWVFERGGQSIKTWLMSAKHMQRTLDEARHGSKHAAEALKVLGLKYDELAKLRPVEQLLHFSEAIARIKNPTRQLGAAMDIFWVRTAQQIMPILKRGRAGIQELLDEADELGLTITTGQADSAGDMGRQWAALDRALRAVKFNIGAGLAPVMTDLLTLVRQHTKGAVGWIQANRGLFLSIAKVGVVLSGLGLTVVTAGTAITVVGMGLSGLSAAVGLVGTGLGLLFTKWGLIGAAAAGAAAALLKFTSAGKGFMAALKGAGSAFTSSWKEIVGAIQAGDLELAFAIAGAAMEVEWQRVVVALQSGWNDFVKAIVDTAKRPEIKMLARIAGGVSGAAIGSRFGPWGAVAGAAIGVAAGDDAAAAVAGKPNGLAVPGRPGETDLATVQRRAGEFPAVLAATPGYLSRLAGETWESMFPGRGRVMHGAARPDPVGDGLRAARRETRRARGSQTSAEWQAWATMFDTRSRVLWPASRPDPAGEVRVEQQRAAAHARIEQERAAEDARRDQERAGQEARARMARPEWMRRRDAERALHGISGGAGLLARVSGAEGPLSGAGAGLESFFAAAMKARGRAIDELRPVIANAMKFDPASAGGGVGLIAKSAQTLFGGDFFREATAAERRLAELQARLEALRKKPPREAALGELERLEKAVVDAKNRVEELQAALFNMTNVRGSGATVGEVFAMEGAVAKAKADLEAARAAMAAKTSLSFGPEYSPEAIRHAVDAKGAFLTLTARQGRQFASDRPEKSMEKKLDRIADGIEGIQGDLRRLGQME